jgi:hypothetical protein
MGKPNEDFKLTVNDIELIETALRHRMHTIGGCPEQKDINRLLGRIHQQKTWYRPKKDYIGG